MLASGKHLIQSHTVHAGDVSTLHNVLGDKFLKSSTGNNMQKLLKCINKQKLICCMINVK
jgi:hypothetical protein